MTELINKLRLGAVIRDDYASTMQATMDLMNQAAEILERVQAGCLGDSPASITLSRSSRGRITLELTTALGAIKVEINESQFARMMFGEACVPAIVTRYLPERKPAIISE